MASHAEPAGAPSTSRARVQRPTRPTSPDAVATFLSRLLEQEDLSTTVDVASVAKVGAPPVRRTEPTSRMLARFGNAKLRVPLGLSAPVARREREHLHVLERRIARWKRGRLSWTEVVDVSHRRSGRSGLAETDNGGQECPFIDEDEIVGNFTMFPLRPDPGVLVRDEKAVIICAPHRRRLSGDCGDLRSLERFRVNSCSEDFFEFSTSTHLSLTGALAAWTFNLPSMIEVRSLGAAAAVAYGSLVRAGRTVLGKLRRIYARN